MKIRFQNLDVYLSQNKGMATRLAKELGVSKGLITHWRNGSVEIPDKHTERICEIIGRPVEDLTKPFSDQKSKQLGPIAEVITDLMDKWPEPAERELLEVALKIQKHLESQKQ